MANYKPGIKTTEFFIALLVVVLGGLPQAFPDGDPWVKMAGIIGAALTAAGYGFVRAKTKAGGTTMIQNATLVPEEEINIPRPPEQQ